MIGRIKNLSATSRSGFIQAENGQTVYFAGSEVWEHDFPFLTVGQAVSFELQSGHWPKAANVHLFEDRHMPHVPESRPQAAVQLRYVGFDQDEYTRSFRFHAIVAGEQTRDYVVTADVRLFQKHHVGIQEGPALCTRVLLAQLALTAGEQRPRSMQAVLTEKELVAHVASRVVAVRKPFRRRPRPMRPQLQRPANSL
jgi:cold shock CspA family protein